MTPSLLREEYEAGATLREIAERHNRTVHFVYTRLLMAGTTMRRRNQHML
jgi:hypothetical protein